MKFKKESLIKSCLGVVLILLLFTLTACDDGNKSTETAFNADPFVTIKGHEHQGLVYNNQTRTVYVLFKEASGYAGYGYIDTYIVNGHICEYRDGKIVEVIPNYEIVDNKIVEIEPTYKEVKVDIVTESIDDKWNSLTQEEKEELLKDK